jgi:hypothetical protein
LVQMPWPFMIGKFHATMAWESGMQVCELRGKLRSAAKAVSIIDAASSPRAGASYAKCGNSVNGYAWLALTT